MTYDADKLNMGVNLDFKLNFTLQVKVNHLPKHLWS